MGSSKRAAARTGKKATAKRFRRPDLDERSASDVNQERRRRLDQHFRAAYIAGAEAAWRALLGRPMTTGDLKTVLKRYRGER